MTQSLNFLLRENLSPEDFEFDEANRKVRLQRSTLKTYDGTWAANVRGHSNSGNRRRLSVKNEIGIIHLDFQISRLSGNTKVCEFPAETPIPNTLIEVQISRGNSVGSIWIDGGSRVVWCSNIPLNQRIIVDLIGFFQ